MLTNDVLEACANLPGAVEDYPFGDGVAVFKVGGRMFAIVPLDDERPSVTLKCDPDIALELRARFTAVQAGYHTNKRHWNTVQLNGSIPVDELQWMIEHSYELVIQKLPRTVRENLAP